MLGRSMLGHSMLRRLGLEAYHVRQVFCPGMPGNLLEILRCLAMMRQLSHLRSLVVLPWCASCLAQDSQLPCHGAPGALPWCSQCLAWDCNVRHVLINVRKYPCQWEPSGYLGTPLCKYPCQWELRLPKFCKYPYQWELTFIIFAIISSLESRDMIVPFQNLGM